MGNEKTNAQRQKMWRDRQKTIGRKTLTVSVSTEALAGLDAWCAAKGTGRREAIEFFFMSAGKRAGSET